MVLRVENVSRRFGPTVACNDVSFAVAPGEVVALLGENGAGKSTLLSIVAGFVEPNAGTIEVAGRSLPPGNPREAIRAGVGTAFQHFSLAPELRVRESLALARIDDRVAAGSLPGHLSPEARIGDLTVPERQQVEFLKARMLARHVLLLDEPTSLLGDDDVEQVLGQIREVAAAGIGVVFVTHRLREALAVADRILVMRRGYIVERLARPDDGWTASTADDLLDAMFGEAGAHEEPEAPAQRGGGATGERIVMHGAMAGRSIDISLEVGRWLAIAGVAGNGQRELAELLAGGGTERVALHGVMGEVRTMQGADAARWVEDHVAVVPEDRFHEGGSVAMTVGENVVLRDLVAGRLDRGGFVSLGRVRERAASLIRRWDIRPANPSAPFGTLSGGNAQRVLLARALDPLPELLVAVRPTHGLDHHSERMVREHLRRAAERGTAVVTIEQELDEALRHADTVAVMYRGRLSPPESTTDADRAALQAMMVRGWAA
jgi:simple sugar transport system ATP-binding protein